MDDDKNHDAENVPFKVKFNYGIGSFASGILNGLVFANLTFFYQIKLGTNADLLILGWMLFAIWNTLNDPIASYFIDNTRTKKGRRTPFIRYGSLLYGLAFIFCWFPISPLDNQIGLFFNFLTALFLLDTMFTIIGACFFSLPNEIAITAKQRANLGIYQVVFGFLNLALGLVLPVILLSGQEGTHPLFGLSIIIIGLVSALILFISSYGIKENMFAQLQPHEGFIEGLRLTLKNKPFWLLMIPAFMIAMILPIFSTGLLYYVDYIIFNQSPLPIIIALPAGVIFGMIFSLYKIQSLQPKKTMIINLAIAAIGASLLFFLIRNTYLSSIPFFLLGIGFAGGSVANTVLMGDAIDNDELITGKRREAIYGGVNAVVTKPALSLANSSFILIIQFFGFNPPLQIGGIDIKQPQTELALLGITIAFSIFPGLLLIISTIAMKFYPLDGSEWINKKKHIMELHAQKEMQYLE
jgi:GPH family glycoside/pentoside/hexuronide:cation symporter